jgi:hypothetical protein
MTIPRFAYLDDAFRYLTYCVERDRSDMVARMYGDWAAKALTEAGEFDLAHDVLVANDRCNPALYDTAWERVRGLREKADE